MIPVILKPSKEIWRYFKGSISPLLVISSCADVMGGYRISYSAKELLKDLQLLTPKGKITKRGHE